MKFDKFIVIDEIASPDKCMEAHVENCDHCHDPTIHLANNLKLWKNIFKNHGEVHSMTSIISHEVIHLAIIKVESNQASMAFDTPCGHGTQYKEEYHGCCRVRYRIRDHKSKSLPTSEAIKRMDMMF